MTDVNKTLSTLRFGYYILSKKRKLLTTMLYVTNRCNLRCKICRIWKDFPKVDLGVEQIKDIVNSKSAKNSSFGLEGGEFILHPRYKEILEIFEGRRYDLLTNGLMVNRIVDVVDEFSVPTVQISLDGMEKIHNEIRGAELYERVIELLKLLKGKTELVINYTISPWNNLEDYTHVKNIADRYGVLLRAALYSSHISQESTAHFFPYKIDNKFYKSYLDKFYAWKNKKLITPCISINYSTTVWWDGDISLCQSKKEILGNLYENKFDKIWNSERTKELQKKYLMCNDCWLAFHRVLDTKVFDLLSMFPSFPIKKFFGGYLITKKRGNKG